MDSIDWEKTFANIFACVGALGNIATFLTFLFLFKKDKEKQAQINKLTIIAAELTQLKGIDKERLNLSVMPDLKFKSMSNGTDGTLDIRIINNGERARLMEFDLTSDDLLIYNERLPYVLDSGNEQKIYIRTKGEKHINDCEYQINIHYTDKIKNLYITELTGKGFRIKTANTYINQKATF